MRNKSKRQLAGLAVLVVAAVLGWKFGPWGKTTEGSPPTQPAAATQPGGRVRRGGSGERRGGEGGGARGAPEA